MRGNYPPGVNENTRGAPWNAPDGYECVKCYRFVNTDGTADADGAKPPETKHGNENSLCETCECEFSKCAECGEWYLENFEGEWFEPSTVRHCPECAPECIATDAPASVEYVAHYFIALRCAVCGAETRRGFAYTNGRREPSRAEFVRVCKPCADAFGTREPFETITAKRQQRGNHATQT